MVRLPAALLVAALLFSTACDSADEPSAELRYVLSLLDNDGATAAAGRLVFEARPVQGKAGGGSFTLTASGGGPLTPLTDTEGAFTSLFTIEGDLVLSVQDPNTTDAGLHLIGTYDGRAYDGEWGTITFAGYTPQGRFLAVLDG